MYLRDGRPNPHLTDVQRAIGSRHSPVVDAYCQPAGHRPGFAFTTDTAARDAKEAAYRDYHRDLENAWTGAGSHGPRGQAEVDLCTIDGRQGRLHRGDDGDFVCVADAQDAQQTMDQLYREHDAVLSQMWRQR